MRSKWKLWLVPLAAVLVLGLWKGPSIWGKDRAPAVQPAVVQTVRAEETQTVKKENVLSFTGDVRALNETVISAKMAGKVSRVAVENGDAVSAGQGLVYLEDAEVTNQLLMNQAALEKAQANLAAVRANYERFKDLYRGGVIAKKDFDDVETALKVAEADAGSAAAAVANARESLRNTVITSPFDGVAANRNVSAGQVLSPGVALMSVLDISSVYVVVNVEQKDLAVVKPGLEAAVTVDTYPGRKFTGVVEIINPSANKTARVFETKIRVPNGEQLLKPGMFARVEIKTGEAEDVLAVPQSALTGKQGMYFVFLLEGDRAVRRQVEAGQVIDRLVEIKSGLAAGQKVIVTNVNKLKDQDTVRIAD
ncbi:MAG: efflux RND transporter periplasmic adaptor subunit [Firmicutes bacterium]|nr:efflux RND transporter periplasmic adaptor subunit [Bacillota bacterium]